MNKFSVALLVALQLVGREALACTGISLRAKDGSVVAARTVEWSLSDAEHYRIAIFPNGKQFIGLTPEGANGKAWIGRFGFVSMTAYGQDYGPDGLNEKGLYVGMYYLPGYASYAQHDPMLTKQALSVGDFMQWMLSSFQTVEEVLQHLPDVRIVNVEDKRFGGAALPFHWKIADPSGRSIVLEIVEGGKLKVYDAVLGVITNAPTYDWHLTNLRNYLNLAPAPSKPLTLDGLALSPLGAGSGMIGLPGDFSPTSRFVRATALTASVRPLASAEEAVFESFRILDSFNIPLGSVLTPDKLPTDISGSTQITSACDLKNRVYYYHTMFNRRVRKLDLSQIDFSRVKQQVIDDDASGLQDVKALQISR